jgi:DNA-binding NtrC family response regulator
VQELLNQGVYGFIQKPYHLSKLSEIVAEALTKDRIEMMSGMVEELRVDA